MVRFAQHAEGFPWHFAGAMRSRASAHVHLPAWLEPESDKPMVDSLHCLPSAIHMQNACSAAMMLAAQNVKGLIRRFFCVACECHLSSLFGKAMLPLCAGHERRIWGFDSKGNERFWTVTGDNVSAMFFADVDGDGRQELV
eukprot:scaffold69270_cov20-Tisochrysis_lutea.AAC.1